MNGDVRMPNSDLHARVGELYDRFRSPMHRTRARFPVLSLLVAVLCAAVLLTSLGNAGLIPAARGEFVNAVPADPPLGNPAIELLQSREFAGFVSGRIGLVPRIAHAVENALAAPDPSALDRAERVGAAAASGQKLHSRYCVWIV